MHIVIDCRFWGPKHSGLGVYTKNLVENLAKIDKKNNYLLIFQQGSVVAPFPANFRTLEVDIPAYSLKEQLVLPFKIAALHPDVVHFMSINVPMLYLGKYVVTVHDLIKHHSKGKDTTTRAPILYWLKYLAYLCVFEWLTMVSAKIIVPSKTVKTELVARGVASNKVVVTYEAATIDAQVKPESVAPLPEKFGFYVGNAYPHKNLENLILAWKEIFKQTGTKLVLAGGRSVFSQRIESFIARHDASHAVVYLGYLSPGQLVTVHKKAQVYVFPTLLEGFGLPGLDAMQMGVPVVCSDIAVLHEIYDDAAYYFDPKNTGDIAAKIIEVIGDIKMRDRLIKKGRQQVEKYSWEKTAAETLKVYESSVSLRSSE